MDRCQVCLDEIYDCFLQKGNRQPRFIWRMNVNVNFLTFLTARGQIELMQKVKWVRGELYGIKYYGNSASRVVRKLDVGKKKHKWNFEDGKQDAVLLGHGQNGIKSAQFDSSVRK